jgi:hypothetical protein
MKDNKICECTSPQLDDGICICGNPINNEFDWCNDSGYNDVFHNEVSDPKEWEELKENLPQWFAEAIIFALGTGVALLIASTILYSILRVIYGV